MSNTVSVTKHFNPHTFDDYAEFYDGVLEWPYRKELELPTIKHLMGDISGLKVMDFGCGPGVIARWIHSQGPAELVGYDISEGMLQHAQKIEEADSLGIKYSSELTKEYDNYFDLILAVYVIPYATHAQELHDIFSSISRMLKPGGKFITLPMHPDFNKDPDYYLDVGFQLIEKEPRQDASKVQLKLDIPPHKIDIEAYYWSRQTIEDTLQQVGFETVTWESLIIPQSYSPSLDSYINCPHAAIVQAIKK